MLHQAQHGIMCPWQDAPCYRCGSTAPLCTSTLWLQCINQSFGGPDRLRMRLTARLCKLTDLKALSMYRASPIRLRLRSGPTWATVVGV
jgi:hypothetical protein